MKYTQNKIVLGVLAGMILMLVASLGYAAPGDPGTAPHMLAWDRESDAQVTGYYVYWRIPPSTAWVNTQRSSVVAQPASGVVPTLDINTLPLTPGNYEFAATARNAGGAESAASNVVPFTEAAPLVAPANLKLQ